MREGPIEQLSFGAELFQATLRRMRNASRQEMIREGETKPEHCRPGLIL
jgi:hypothetical protein